MNSMMNKPGQVFRELYIAVILPLAGTLGVLFIGLHLEPGPDTSFDRTLGDYFISAGTGFAVLGLLIGLFVWASNTIELVKVRILALVVGAAVSVGAMMTTWYLGDPILAVWTLQISVITVPVIVGVYLVHGLSILIPQKTPQRSGDRPLSEVGDDLVNSRSDDAGR